MSSGKSIQTLLLLISYTLCVFAAEESVHTASPTAYAQCFKSCVKIQLSFIVYMNGLTEANVENVRSGRIQVH